MINQGDSTRESVDKRRPMCRPTSIRVDREGLPAPQLKSLYFSSRFCVLVGILSDSYEFPLLTGSLQVIEILEDPRTVRLTVEVEGSVFSSWGNESVGPAPGTHYSYVGPRPESRSRKSTRNLFPCTRLLKCVK